MYDNRDGQLRFGASPKISIDLAIRSKHPKPINFPDLSLEDSLIDAPNTVVREILAKFSNLVPYIEVIKLFYHLDDTEPQIFLCCRVVVVQPLTGKKATIPAEAVVFRFNEEGKLVGQVDALITLGQIPANLKEEGRRIISAMEGEFLAGQSAAHNFHLVLWEDDSFGP